MNTAAFRFYDEWNDLLVPETVACSFAQFWPCCSCDTAYWQDSHVRRMNAVLENILSELYL